MYGADKGLDVVIGQCPWSSSAGCSLAQNDVREF
jgi:hypothetical protein